MRISSIINTCVLVAIAALGYLATTHFDQQTSKINIQPDAPVENITEGQAIPEFSFTATDGKTYTITDFKDKAIILNFWASWCAPCIKEIPHFIKAAQTYNDGVIFIGISSDIDEQAMKKFLKKHVTAQEENMFFALDADSSITKNLFQTYSLPETILINKNLKMRTKIIGADWTYEDLKKQIEALL